MQPEQQHQLLRDREMRLHSTLGRGDPPRKQAATLLDLASVQRILHCPELAVGSIRRALGQIGVMFDAYGDAPHYQVLAADLSVDERDIVMRGLIRYARVLCDQDRPQRADMVLRSMIAADYRSEGVELLHTCGVTQIDLGTKPIAGPERRALVNNGRVEQGLAYLRKAEALAGQQGSTVPDWSWPDNQRFQARAHLWLGQRAEARNRFDDAEQTSDEAGVGNGLLLDRGWTRRSEDDLHRAANLALSVPLPGTFAAAMDLLGDLYRSRPGGQRRGASYHLAGLLTQPFGHSTRRAAVSEDKFREAAAGFGLPRYLPDLLEEGKEGPWLATAVDKLGERDPVVRSQLFARLLDNRLPAAEFSEREGQIARLLIQRVTASRDIASCLVLAVGTIDNHIWRMMKKAGVTSRAGLVEYLIHSGYGEISRYETAL